MAVGKWAGGFLYYREIEGIRVYEGTVDVVLGQYCERLCGIKVVRALGCGAILLGRNGSWPNYRDVE